MKTLAISKIVNSEAEAIEGRQFKDLSPSQKHYVLSCIVGDDWGTVLKTVAPPLLNHIWNTLKTTPIYKKAQKFLTD